MADGLFEGAFSPEVSGGEDGNDFKVDEIFPADNPGVQRFHIRRFHHLETPSAGQINPARVMADALGQHSATLLESFTNGRCVAVPEVFNDHVEHEGSVRHVVHGSNGRARHRNPMEWV